MAAGIPRYLVETGQNALGPAFSGILKLCAEQSINRITLVVPSKGQFPNTLVGKFLGTATTKALLSGKAVAMMTGGPVMAVQSPATFSRGAFNQSMIVCAHISGDDQRRIDDAPGAKAIVYLPWKEPDGKEWLATWHPKTIGPSTWTAPSNTLAPPVEAALERLTNIINLGAGLGHPSDKAAAVSMVAKLRTEGHAFDSREMKRWALRHGWSSNAAQALEDLAMK